MEIIFSVHNIYGQLATATRLITIIPPCEEGQTLCEGIDGEGVCLEVGRSGACASPGCLQLLPSCAQAASPSI